MGNEEKEIEKIEINKTSDDEIDEFIPKKPIYLKVRNFKNKIIFINLYN